LNPYKYKLTAFALSLLAVCNVSQAQSASQPDIKEHDTWDYRFTDTNAAGVTTEELVTSEVTRVGGNDFSVARRLKTSNSLAKEKMEYKDWSATVNTNGTIMLLAQKFKFPLSQGKTWGVEAKINDPEPKIKLRKVVHNYKVVAIEDVTVPAGVFHAYRIDDEGTLYQEYNPTAATSKAESAATTQGAAVLVQNHSSSTPSPTIQKFSNSYWYAPEVKRDVKFIEDLYTTTGALINRTAFELLSYKVQ
jgi:hypothetical protein